MLNILPLTVQFQEVLKSFAPGFLKNSRDATRSFVEGQMAFASSEHEDVEGGLSSAADVMFTDGSSMRTTIVRFNDGTMAFSHTFLATSAESMSALLDLAASGFTEMDTQSLAAGLSK